jgi:hypothetical protein
MKNKIVSGILIGCILVAFLVGCNLFNKSAGSDPFSGMTIATLSGTLERATSVPFHEPTRIPTVDHGPFILMLDDFSDSSSGWEISEGDNGRVAYEDGGYLVESYVEGQYYWGEAGQNFDDVRIEVDAKVLQTNTENNDAFGVDCRVQENDDGYGFRISSDGYVAIFLYLDGDGTPLLDWEPNSAVYVDGRPNHLTVIWSAVHKIGRAHV